MNGIMKEEKAPENRGLLGFLPPSSRRAWLLGILLVVATVIAYGPALTAGFVWDDSLNLTDNPLLTAAGGLRRIWFSLQSASPYFPLTFTTFYLEHRVWGLNPAGYHLINILLHAANALLLWQLLTRLRVPAAWLAAAIFALHPVQVESVAWISERKNVLMALFFLLALLAWVNFIDERRPCSWRPYILALLFYAFSLLAKTTACTLPAALLLILWLRKMPITRARLFEIAPFVILGVALGLAVMHSERHHQGSQPNLFAVSPLQRMLIASRALWFYACKLLWPARLTVDYGHWNISPSDPLNYIWPLATAAVPLMIWRLRQWTGRSLEVAALFFAATLSPMLGIIMHYMFAYSFVADHFQYLACIGPIALATARIKIGMDRIDPGKQILQRVLCAVLLVTLGILTWRQCEIYTDSDTLWLSTFKQNPRSLLANANLGNIASDAGELDEAISHFQKALATRSDFIALHYNLGLCYFRLGQFDQAIDEFQKEIAVNPDFSGVHNNLGLALVQKGQLDGAIAEYKKALALDPDLAAAHDNLGAVLLKKGRLDEAIAHLQKAVELDPRLIGEQNCLGIAFAEKGQPRGGHRPFPKSDGKRSQRRQTVPQSGVAPGHHHRLIAARRSRSPGPRPTGHQPSPARGPRNSANPGRGGSRHGELQRGDGHRRSCLGPCHQQKQLAGGKLTGRNQALPIRSSGPRCPQPLVLRTVRTLPFLSHGSA